MAALAGCCISVGDYVGAAEDRMNWPSTEKVLGDERNADGGCAYSFRSVRGFCVLPSVIMIP